MSLSISFSPLPFFSFSFLSSCCPPVCSPSETGTPVLLLSPHVSVVSVHQKPRIVACITLLIRSYFNLHIKLKSDTSFICICLPKLIIHV